MFSRSWFAFMMAGAVGLPYLYSASLGSSKSGRGVASLMSKPAGNIALPVVDEPQSTPSPALIDKAPTQNELGEVFRWEITTSWILGHWPRVSAGLADVELQGYRVPLVTGTATDDLAGSLTYYFNKRQRLQRITFFGTTGDSRRLVALLATRFGFVRELHDDPGLFLYRVRSGRKVISELRIKPTSVVRADAPFSRFNVALLIDRPEE
jgi:hypothetical protein